MSHDPSCGLSAPSTAARAGETSWVPGNSRAGRRRASGRRKDPLAAHKRRVRKIVEQITELSLLLQELHEEIPLPKDFVAREEHQKPYTVAMYLRSALEGASLDHLNPAARDLQAAVEVTEAWLTDQFHGIR